MSGSRAKKLRKIAYPDDLAFGPTARHYAYTPKGLIADPNRRYYQRLKKAWMTEREAWAPSVL